MSTLIANHNNGDLEDVEFDLGRITFLLPNRKSKPAGDAAFCIAVRDTRDIDPNARCVVPARF
jgi:hypothetical protein